MNNKKLLKKLLKDYNIDIIGIERERYQQVDAICGTINVPSHNMTVTLELIRKTK